MIKHIYNKIFIFINNAFLSYKISKYELKHYNMKPFMDFIKTACNILDIEIPRIAVIPYMFESEKKRKINFLSKYLDLPNDYYWVLGYYYPYLHQVIICRYDPHAYTEPDSEYTDSELIYIIFHELRHIWQQKYHEDLYFSNINMGVNYEYSLSKADADSFAAAALKHLTNYEMYENDFGFVAYRTSDGGLRNTKYKEIEKMYFA